MEQSSAQRALQYIDEHPHIKWCLVQGLLNYTALSRRIAHELRRDLPSTHAAIVVAARRYRDLLRKQATTEKEIRVLLERSALDLHSRIAVAVLGQHLSEQSIFDAQQRLREAGGIVYAVRGTAHWTFIYEERHEQQITRLLKAAEKVARGLALVVVKSPQEIETTVGVCAYLAGLFAENGVNIVEFLSCWTDTLFVIKQADVPRTIGFLQFAAPEKEHSHKT